MFSCIRKRLLFLGFCMASALPQPSSTTSLPQPLQSLVPSCSWSCLASFIQGNFPATACSDSADLDCLCSHASISSFSLGEAAFVCAHQHCEGVQSDSVINSTYQICSGKPNAITPSHTVLPTSFAATPTPTSTSGSTSASTASITSNPSAMSSSPTPDTPPRQGLQTSQIIGITVASAAVAIVAIAIAIFAYCMRRRKRNMEKLGSGKLSYEEFQTPSPPIPAPYTRLVDPGVALKDPRKGTGGAGGVGVAPAPVRYKAILPPANLFSNVYPERPDDIGTVAPPTNAAVRQQSTAPAIAVLPPSPPRPIEPTNTTTLKKTNHPTIAQPLQSSSSSLYSVDRHVPREAVPALPKAAAKAQLPRQPSLLLPDRPDLMSEQDTRYSVASNVTQFEEDEKPQRVVSDVTQFEEDLRSPGFPGGMTTMPLVLNGSSTEISSSTGTETSTPPAQSQPPLGHRKSRGPSLKINIPFNPQNDTPDRFAMPPPPPRNQAKNAPPLRPRLANAAATAFQFPVPPRGTVPKNDPAQTQRQTRFVDPAVQSGFLPPPPKSQPPQRSPPLQFPVPPAGQGVPRAPPDVTGRERKESLSRRGFSQPKPFAVTNNYQTNPGPTTNQRIANATAANPGATGPFTVNGERVNYPTIPRSQASPPAPSIVPQGQMSYGNLPPPPSYPPPVRLVGPGSGSHRSNDSMGSHLSSANSLLAKRRGSAKATQMFLGGSPKNFRGAGHGRTDSKTTIESPPVSGTSSQPTHASVRSWLDNQSRWASNSRPTGAQAQYVPYQIPPPPPRQGAQGQAGMGAMQSPMPTKMTPTRRGDDLYLSVS